MNVTVAEMKANLANILRKAAAGEEIIVTKHGKPYARVGPNSEKVPSRSPIGAFANVPFRMSDDFDELGPEWDEYVK